MCDKHEKKHAVTVIGGSLRQNKSAGSCSKGSNQQQIIYIMQKEKKGRADFTVREMSIITLMPCHGSLHYNNFLTTSRTTLLSTTLLSTTLLRTTLLSTTLLSTTLLSTTLLNKHTNPLCVKYREILDLQPHFEERERE